MFQLMDLVLCIHKVSSDLKMTTKIFEVTMLLLLNRKSFLVKFIDSHIYVYRMYQKLLPNFREYSLAQFEPK
jgi:hypothetical protein